MLRIGQKQGDQLVGWYRCWTRMVAVELVKCDWNMDIFEGRVERVC